MKYVKFLAVVLAVAAFAVPAQAVAPFAQSSNTALHQSPSARPPLVNRAACSYDNDVDSDGGFVDRIHGGYAILIDPTGTNVPGDPGCNQSPTYNYALDSVDLFFFDMGYFGYCTIGGTETYEVDVVCSGTGSLCSGPGASLLAAPIVLPVNFACGLAYFGINVPLNVTIDQPVYLTLTEISNTTNGEAGGFFLDIFESVGLGEQFVDGDVYNDGRIGLGINGEADSANAVDACTFSGYSNDTCAGATAVGDGDTQYGNEGAATDGTAQGVCADVPADVWFDYASSCFGQVDVSTDTAADIQIFGNGCPANAGVNCDASGSGSASLAGVALGQHLAIRVGGAEVCPGTLTVSCTPTGACCNAGACTGDGLSQADCENSGGQWTPFADCTGAGTLPAADCEVPAECSWDNGPILDEDGGPSAQVIAACDLSYYGFQPIAAVDDVILPSSTGLCRITRAEAGYVSFNPDDWGFGDDQCGMWVAAIPDAGGAPACVPEFDVGFNFVCPCCLDSEFVTQANMTNSLVATTCQTGNQWWKTVMTMDLTVPANQRVWLALLPVDPVDFSTFGQTGWLYSSENHLLVATRSFLGGPLTDLSGNSGLCSDGSSSGRDPGTRRNLNFLVQGAACDDCDSNGVCDDTQTDSDGDGFIDPCDNCPNDANPGQEDCNGDGQGDVCDPDTPDQDPDHDGLCNSDDNCDFTANPGQLDTDGDGQGDACDPCPIDPNDDSDGDGSCDSVDLCPGFDDNADVDGDGVPDGCDVCPPGVGDANSDDNAPGALDDSDGDGVINCNDLCNGVDDGVFGPECDGAIPTVSEWGLVVLALLLLVAGKVYFGRRESTA